jgi:K+-sensing histidine kinase KdpD
VVGAKPSPGTGIGLFVADAIVRALGGRIWAENRAEGGADVAFALPIAEA